MRFAPNLRLMASRFPLRLDARARYTFDAPTFTDFARARELSAVINATRDLESQPQRAVKAGRLAAAALLDEIFAHSIALYCDEIEGDALEEAPSYLEENVGAREIAELMGALRAQFGDFASRPATIEAGVRLRLANLNPALETFRELFDDTTLPASWSLAWAALDSYFAALPGFGPDDLPLLQFLLAPLRAHPDSVEEQLRFILARWGRIAAPFAARLLTHLDVIREEEKPTFFGPGPAHVATYDDGKGGAGAGRVVGMDEHEAFSPDREWMPRVVLLAKSTYVWLDQLSKKYGEHIYRLDQVPDQELDELSDYGITGLWLIGLWQRSKASQDIKQITGNPDALASAYSLFSYDVAWEIGGQEALDNLSARAAQRGIRMASDMVPNHMAIDSRWVIEHPDWFLSLPHQPFPDGNFDTPDLCDDARASIYLEAGYYDKTDASVVFKRVDSWSSETRYIYHGNDGTSIPWNDTAQLNYLMPEVREAALQTILHVAQQFPIIRFDAAMTLAKRHFHRLWFPAPGEGGDIPSRAGRGLSGAEFDAAMPVEFWREVVDLVARERPDTLLLAEAFWMMESYFVRTLGMHRVYNSAFMHMLRDEDNQSYRLTLKNTLEFDPDILGRFVNFMNNPDEETAVEQFGKGDKYFGVCTLLATLPGLPMFGHGQLEGYAEKYGMEYPRAYWDEKLDEPFLAHHKTAIFPLLKRRALFAGSANFTLYDFWSGNRVNENVFAYSNCSGEDKAIVIYNNKYQKTSGWIKTSVSFVEKQGDGNKVMCQRTLGDALALTPTDHHWTIFRDNSSGLEFIRSSKELREQGMFVELGEYGCQVFLDFREVQDEGGLHQKLAGLLAGRGVPSVARALQEILLEPVLAPFRQLCDADLWAQVLGIAPKSAQAEAEVKAASDASIEARGVAGDIDAPANRETDAETDAETENVETVEPDAAALQTLETRWLRVARAIKQFAKSRADEAQLLVALHARLERAIASNAPASMRAQLLAYALVVDLGALDGDGSDGDGSDGDGSGGASAARSRQRFDDWLLGESLAAPLAQLGAPAHSVAEIGWWLAHLRVAQGQSAEPFALLMQLLADESAKTHLGVNRFENTLWFRAEGWRQLRDVLQRGADFEDAALPLASLDSAATASGYRVVSWMEAARATGKNEVAKQLTPQRRASKETAPQ